MATDQELTTKPYRANILRELYYLSNIQNIQEARKDGQMVRNQLTDRQKAMNLYNAINNIENSKKVIRQDVDGVVIRKRCN